VERAGHELRRAEQSGGRSRVSGGKVEMDEFADDVREAQQENAAEDEELDEESDEESDGESDEESKESDKVVRDALAQLQAGEKELM
jgi:hypothetical protein